MTLLLDWLSREAHLLVAWWLAITLAGAAVYPLCFRLLGGLPDRGYTLARPFGLLIVASCFWLLGCFGVMENTRGGMLLSWCLVASFCALYAGRGISLRDAAEWWRENRALVLFAELLFMALFVGWAFFRAHQNEILYTEKPMELAFMSAAQRSPVFPPSDPWLSGYAISYYYLGYVISGMLSMVSGHGSAIGFNLTIAASFALTGLSGFGVVYNLARSRAFEFRESLRDAEARRSFALAAGGLAALLLTLVGNFQAPLIEFPYQSRAASAEYLDFWGTQDRSNFADGVYVQDPHAPWLSDSAGWDYWWWFRASRVLTDYNLDGSFSGIQPIDEFPAFSFLLADNHPHVLSLPFSIAALGLMFNVVNCRRAPGRDAIVLYGVVIGGLAFLNAWDAPIYLVGLLAAEGLRRLMLNDRGRLGFGDLTQMAILALALAAIALIAYMPFFVGFRSQAGGILPNLAQPTALQRSFIAFGPFFALIPPYLLAEVLRGRSGGRLNPRLAATLTLAFALALTVSMLLFGAILLARDGWLPGIGAAQMSPDLWNSLMSRRFSHVGTTLMLLLGLAAALSRLLPKHNAEPGSRITYSRATGLALLLIGLGCCLTLLPEFVILRDNFVSRINTVFKLYYQAWAFWSVAAAYGVYSMLADSKLRLTSASWRAAYAVLSAVALVGGLAYSVYGIRQRAWHETTQRYPMPEHWTQPNLLVEDGDWIQAGMALMSDSGASEADEASILRAQEDGLVTVAADAVVVMPQLTLDGGKSFASDSDRRVIECLRNLVGRDETVVAEAVMNAYDANYGRVGALSGIPIVLGWENHERQWRGSTYFDIAGARRHDLDTLYESTDMSQAADIVRHYNIEYILYGETERRQYGSRGEEKFLDSLPLVCEAGTSRVFAAHPLLRQ